jgi:hypothetical protein
MCSRDEHAQTNEQIAQDFRIARQRICEQDISKFPIRGLRNAADADALERCERAAAPVAADEWNGRDETDYEEE